MLANNIGMYSSAQILLDYYFGLFLIVVDCSLSFLMKDNNKRLFGISML